MGKVLPGNLPFLGMQGTQWMQWQAQYLSEPYCDIPRDEEHPPPEVTTAQDLSKTPAQCLARGVGRAGAALCHHVAPHSGQEVTPLRCPCSCLSNLNARLPWRQWDTISPRGSDGSEMQARASKGSILAQWQHITCAALLLPWERITQRGAAHNRIPSGSCV